MHDLSRLLRGCPNVNRVLIFLCGVSDHLDLLLAPRRVEDGLLFESVLNLLEVLLDILRFVELQLHFFDVELQLLNPIHPWDVFDSDYLVRVELPLQLGVLLL